MLSTQEASEADIAKALQRPAQDLNPYRRKTIPLIDAVRRRGDAAVREYTQQFDGVQLENIRIPAVAITQAMDRVAPELLKSIQTAAANIRTFHERQSSLADAREIQPGVRCWREVRPIDFVGLYVPGGTAPIFSTVLMLGIPAKIAGVKRIIVCTPPSKEAGGTIPDVTLAACAVIGIDDVYVVGGAQAIAAMAYGTETIPKVQKICGPGNAYVTAAKAEVSIDPQGAAIDMLAGPSEILIIADETADPSWVAADLLSQAEHDIVSQVTLLTTSQSLIDMVLQEIDGQLATLPRKDIARQCLDTSVIIFTRSIEEAVELSNGYAPEHVSLQVEQPRDWLKHIRSAGSIFLGPFSAEVYGDYCSGPNHVLPTMGLAAQRGGLSVSDFQKIMTVQELTKNGARSLTPIATMLARAERLDAHARAADIRFKSPAQP